MFCKYRYIILLTLASMTVLANSGRLSGLYVDNGLDQTIAHQTINFKDKKDIEYKLLNILGLRDRPKRITKRAYLVKRSAPKFLLNIYSNVLYNDKDVESKIMDNNQEFGLTGQDINAIDQSDVIMTFGGHNPHSIFGARKNRGRRIWFDVSEVPDIEHIIAAELRLYQSTNFEKLPRNVSYTIAVYRVARTENGKRLKHYIDSRNVTIGREGWIALNISGGLEYWINHPNENRGLFLTIRGDDSHTLRPDDIGIVGVLGIPEKQPFMVGFFRSSGTRKTIARIKRNAQEQNNELMTKSLRNNPFIDKAVRRSTKACSIQTLYVNFRDLQWQDWIIAPEGYDAYYCSGECNFPLNSHMNATNHAIVQTLVHLIKPGKVPKPCCSPTELSPISVLYFLDDSNVVLKKYNNMVVSSCGCH